MNGSLSVCPVMSWQPVQGVHNFNDHSNRYMSSGAQSRMFMNKKSAFIKDFVINSTGSHISDLCLQWGIK